MQSGTYQERRGEIEAYFDRTAADAWARLTSDAPVSGIRATVRKGRDDMRNTLLDWLPADLTGRRLLDAGCGPGMLSIEAARRGAEVVAVDLSPTLLDLARARIPADLAGKVTFVAGDMLSPEFGRFDHVVAMDSLIHYRAEDAARAVAGLVARTSQSLVFTFAPRTAALALMHFVGGFFPRSDRAPSIEPVREETLRGLIAAEPAFAGWRTGRTRRIAVGFYTSQALELVPA
ncbi:Magnesium-protoporphyrin O-methyltransferase [Rhodoplanes serenus]|uniref:Magnesium protoporphyrin IX methyltransferase n=1 Tax=Rhodoplanes serenus TaxID=200615 RepID=A0A3S4AY62_9BRAD|nr:magnesium protoporphyrin IX methyltransferase [Rhodoplanes serenus]VCU07078.1 Magnesium-protoporphyrin O-methyltransferase [Rhodoplanes serenus]